jgi:hypothetical protein
MTENNTASELSDSQKGISNTTLAVLIVLALVVTIIGTFGVLYNVNSHPTQIREGGSGVGVVSLTVIPLEKSINKDTGVVTLEVKK